MQPSSLVSTLYSPVDYHSLLWSTVVGWCMEFTFPGEQKSLTVDPQKGAGVPYHTVLLPYDKSLSYSATGTFYHLCVIDTAQRLFTVSRTRKYKHRAILHKHTAKPPNESSQPEFEILKLFWF